tara:strand:- start:2332 stop:2955 length:624 start_codon:yes stop_codon:yes gene_type:complete
MGPYIPPPAFHTFDPIRLSPNNLVDAISSSINGNHAELLEKLEGLSGVPEFVEGDAPGMDKSTLLFISVLDWQGDGSSPRPLDGGHSRERIGRFPHSDGNAIEYLLENTGEGEDSQLHDLLGKLGRGLGENAFGFPDYDKGAGGMELLGWLEEGEITDLRKEIERGSWSVMSDEPLDGGVQDAFRHLLVILRAATRRRCGIIMRRHS